MPTDGVEFDTGSMSMDAGMMPAQSPNNYAPPQDTESSGRPESTWDPEKGEVWKTEAVSEPSIIQEPFLAEPPPKPVDLLDTSNHEEQKPVEQSEIEELD